MRKVALAVLAIAAIAWSGCAGSTTTTTGALPPDLPPSPQPGKRYCKVWVPATHRKVPKLVKADCGGTRTETITVMETKACEVMVKAPETRTVRACDRRCEQTAVQVKPGGYRWENHDGCWEYKYRAPEYKWCDKTRQEEGIKFCYQAPAEYETIVNTRPVQRERTTYVPPQYRVEWVEEEFIPGHWEWQASQACGPQPDPRATQSFDLKNDCKRVCPPAKALDCGCPRTN